MRETDDEVVRRSLISPTARVGAFGEAGDILQPIAAGVIGKRRCWAICSTDAQERGRPPLRAGHHVLQVGSRCR
jgi:hypothetical protein